MQADVPYKKGKDHPKEGGLERAEKEEAVSVSLRPKGAWWSRGKAAQLKGEGRSKGAVGAPLNHLSELFLPCQNPVSIIYLSHLQSKSASQQKHNLTSNFFMPTELSFHG